MVTNVLGRNETNIQVYLCRLSAPKAIPSGAPLHRVKEHAGQYACATHMAAPAAPLASFRSCPRTTPGLAEPALKQATLAGLLRLRLHQT